jgi:N-acetylneuraminate lyase
VGSTSYKESQALAVHAARQGAWAISVMGPAFFQPQRAEELTAYCEKIAKVVPDLPFYYYHIPGRSGVHVSMKDFLMLVRKRIPGFAGLKFSHTDFLELQQCLMVENGKFDILFGFDHLLLSALPFGVEGAIGTTFNFMAGFYYDIMDAFKNGDLEKARYFQFRAVQVVEILLRYGGDGMAASKAIMGLCGLDCGPCRPPVQNLTEKEIRHMEAELKQIGFFDTIVDL